MTLVLLQKMAVLFIYLLAGFILVKAGVLKSDDSKVLSKFIIYLFGPCAALAAFQTDFSSLIARGFLLAIGGNILIYAVNFIVVYGFSRTLKLDVIERGTVIYTNSVNLLMPLIIMALGEEYTIFVCANNAVQGLLMWTHADSMMRGETRINLKKVLLNVNIIAIVVGLIMFFTRLKFPELIGEAVSGMGTMLGPTSMFIIGMITAEVKWKEQLSNWRIYMVSALRLLVLPFIMLIIFKYSGLAGLLPDGQMILYVCMLTAATPSATLITQLSLLYDRDTEYSVAITVLTTLLCIITMPLFTQLYF